MTPEALQRLERVAECDLVTATRDDFKNMMREALRDELTACGIISENAEQKREMQADFSFLRSLRETYQSIVNKVGAAVVLGVIGAVFTLVAAGLSYKFGK